MQKKIREFQSSQKRSFTISNSKDLNPFSKLALKYGSDKDGVAGLPTPFNWPHHTYGGFYEFLFSHRRQQISNVFECGIGSRNPTISSNMGIGGSPGASLKLWTEYFPQCQVIAIDIDESVLVTNSRIRSFKVDQTSKESILRFWSQIPQIEFDLMVDDGLHNVHAGMTLLTHSIDRLRPDGYYIIEDVSVNDLSEFSRRLSAGGFDFYTVTLSRPVEFGFDNNLLVIRKNG